MQPIRRKREELSEVLKAQLTCPVCLELYTGTVLCPCGHTLCNICAERLNRSTMRRCPICRFPFRKTSEPNGLFEELMKQVKIDCKFKDLGCPKHITLHEKRSHEAECVYNIGLPCPFMRLLEEEEVLQSCTAEVTTKTILAHLTTVHQVEVMHCAYSKKTVVVTMPNSIASLSFVKLDRVVLGSEGAYHVMISFLLGSLEIAVALLDNKKTQRMVTMEIQRDKDRLTMSRPTYGLQGDHLAVAVFQLSEDDIQHYIDVKKLRVSIAVTTPRN